MAKKKYILPKMLIVYLSVVFLLSFFIFNKRRGESYSNLNSSLHAAAYSLDLILGKDFHDKYNQHHPISRKKFQDIKVTLNKFADSLGLEFVYSMVKKHDKIYFVVSNETGDDLRRGTYSTFYNLYPDPPEDLLKTFYSGEITYHYYYSYTNIRDSYYSIFIPRKTSKGLTYILAADVKLKKENAVLTKSIYESAVLAFLLLIPLLLAYFIIKSNFTEKETELSSRLYIDSLTGLPNRKKYLEDMKDKRLHKKSIIMFDIDSFRDINNLFGSHIGDKVLIRVSEIIKSICSPASKLYKFPVDEFVVISEENSKEIIIDTVKQIVKAVASENFISIGQPLDLTVRAGIAFKPDNQSRLLSCGNIAKNYAKAERKEFSMYKDTVDSEKKYTMNYYLLSRLKEALKDNRIVPYYQPILNNYTGKVEKYEALVRLIDIDGTVITPDQFLDIAKRSKLYKEISHSMISQTFMDFADSEYMVSLNFSTRDIIDEDTVNFIIENVERYSMRDRVIIELVESESFNEYEKVIALTKKFSELGIRIAIDDFGSGYSNFEYLSQFNTDYLKIDGSIIRNIPDQKNSDALVAAISSFAKELNITLIAEYVSSDKVIARLKELNVEYSQGYYIGRPAPYSEIFREKPADTPEKYQMNNPVASSGVSKT